MTSCAQRDCLHRLSNASVAMGHQYCGLHSRGCTLGAKKKVRAEDLHSLLDMLSTQERTDYDTLRKKGRYRRHDALESIGRLDIRVTA